MNWKGNTIEKTELWITCDTPLQGDGRALRGFFGNLYRNRPEFHNHSGDRLLYRHPLVQYKVFGGSALVVGLKEGAYLLKAVPELDSVQIGHRRTGVVKRNVANTVAPFGLTNETAHYAFVKPWIGLNETNYQTYLSLRDQGEERVAVLNRIIAANILSMCKSLGYTVDGRLRVDSALRENTPVVIKDDVQTGFVSGRVCS